MIPVRLGDSVTFHKGAGWPVNGFVWSASPKAIEIRSYQSVNNNGTMPYIARVSPKQFLKCQLVEPNRCCPVELWIDEKTGVGLR